MIKKLDETYRESLFTFLKRSPEMNLFIIGDIEAYGFDKPFQEVWAEFDEMNNYIAVLLRYKVHFVFTAVSDDYNAELFSRIIQNCRDKNVVSGELSAVKSLALKLKFKKHKEMFFARLTALSADALSTDIVTSPSPFVCIASVDAAEEICALRETIQEFSDVKMSVEGIRENIESGFARTFYIRMDGRIVAAASTTAENSSSAMVVAVMTHPDYRNRGLATLCVHKLCETLLFEGRTLCLFYDNPKAGSIYQHLGFEDIGKWVMMVL